MTLEWEPFSDLIHKNVRTLEKGTTHTEAYFTMTETTEVAIRNSEILTQNRLTDAGVGFRVAIKNKVGFSCTNTLTEKALINAGEKAVSIARVSAEIPHFTLPGPGQRAAVKKTYDPQVAEITVGEAVDVAHRLITAAEGIDPRVRAKSGRVVFQSGWRGIVNTLGVDHEEKETKAVLYLGGVGEYNGEVTGVCTDVEFGRTADISPEKVGEAVGEKVVKMVNPQPMKSFKGTCIFGPEACSYQIADVLTDALKGESVMAGRSFWTGKIGEKVASENLSVTDNALLENGFSSRGFDDEGCPSTDTALLKNGTLQSYLHNATTAHALKTENTANASRFPSGFDMVRSIIGSGYRTAPESFPSNLVIHPGNKSKEQLISEVEKGLVIESMAGFAQKGSGLISAQLSQAFFIQNGEIQYPVKGGMVSGVAFDWFNTISGIGNDVKQFDNAVVPSLRVEDVTVVGG